MYKQELNKSLWYSQYYKKFIFILLFNLIICDLIGYTHILPLSIVDVYTTNSLSIIYINIFNCSLIQNDWYDSLMSTTLKLKSQMYQTMPPTIALIITINRFASIICPFGI